MGSAAGARRTAARRLGLTETEYEARAAAGEKWCIACQAWRARNDFARDRSRGDGLMSRCRSHSARADGHPTKAERVTAALVGTAWCRRCFAWLPVDAVHAGLCRPHANEYDRERYAATKGHNRRGRAAARRRNVRPVGTGTRELLYETTGGLCAYSCGRPATTLDHVIPVADGGVSGPGLMVPACGPCNSAKRDGDPWPWIARMTDDALDLVLPGLMHDGALVDLLT